MNNKRNTKMILFAGLIGIMIVSFSGIDFIDASKQKEKSNQRYNTPLTSYFNLRHI